MHRGCWADVTSRRRNQLIAASFALLLAAIAMSCDGDKTPPDECDADPLDSPACGRALDARCREQTSQEDCESQGPWDFEGYVVHYGCNWARRVTFDDVASCALREATNVCVAVFRDSPLGCQEGCAGERDSYSTFWASNLADEVYILRCPAEGDDVSGPVDGSVAKSDDSINYQPCGNDVTPQARADLCACREQACDAVERL